MLAFPVQRTYSTNKNQTLEYLRIPFIRSSKSSLKLSNLYLKVLNLISLLRFSSPLKRLTLSLLYTNLSINSYNLSLNSSIARGLTTTLLKILLALG